MREKKPKLIHVVSLIFAFILPSLQSHVVFSEDVSEDVEVSDSSINNPAANLEDELAWLREENYVSIATKSKQKISRAPSIVTVITAEEIENMGFRTLPEVIRTVPGFDIIKGADLGDVLMGVRGISKSDEKIKVLIDDHLVNNPLDGTAVDFIDNLSVKNIKRIEIIRGPGSALYGANAFLAVINIITKDAVDIDGIEVTSGFGSYDTQEYSILFGKQFYGIDIAGFADFYNTNGLSDTIKADALSSSLLFRRFSIAPGDTDDSRNKLNLNLKLSYKDLEFNARYRNKDTEPFVGSAFVLTDDVDQQFNYVMADLRYKYDIGDRLTVKPRIYYDQYDIVMDFEILPDGFTIPFDLDGDGDIEKFPDGLNADARSTTRRLGADIQMDYDLFDNNVLTAGFNYEWEKQEKVHFLADFDPLTFASQGFMRDFSDSASFLREVTRQIWSIYLQDKWTISDDLELTFGIRHDHYSDFEGTTNPRFGIVWDFMEDTTLKLLYGQAFRAPSFLELYTINNPVVLGTPDLKPETIRTYEVALTHKFTENLNVNVNYFFNVIRDTIDVAPGRAPQVFENLAGSNIQGVEFEARADLSDFWKWGGYAFANYTYQDAESKGDPLPDVPKHKGNMGVNLGITKYINANLNAFISDSRVRAEADDRDDSPGYALFNLTLIAKDFFKGFKAKASLFNLLDKKYDDPAPMNTISTDLPRPGRTFFFEIGYDW